MREPTPEEQRLQDLWLAGTEYQDRGWKVFALGSDKVPLRNCGTRVCREHALPSEMTGCKCVTCHGPYAASGNAEKLGDQLELAGPDAHLALRTGRASGVVVVDLDPKPEHPLPKLLSVMQGLMRHGGSTVLANRTPRGGMHLYFAAGEHLIPNSASKIAAGIDVRGEGGYVVLPPSSGRRWVPGSDLNGRGPGDYPALTPALVEAMTQSRTFEPGDVRAGRARGNLDSLCRFIVDSLPGERNTSLYWASRRAGELVVAGKVNKHEATLRLIEAAGAAGLGSREARPVVENGILRSEREANFL